MKVLFRCLLVLVFGMGLVAVSAAPSMGFASAGAGGEPGDCNPGVRDRYDPPPFVGTIYGQFDPATEGSEVGTVYFWTPPEGISMPSNPECKILIKKAMNS